jgi:hypothetical protein
MQYVRKLKITYTEIGKPYCSAEILTQDADYRELELRTVLPK